MDYPQEKVMPYGSEGRKAEQVERMFDHIAPAYDRLNHLMSLGIDRSWRRRAIRWLAPFRPQEVLDVATGTGDFALLACRLLRPHTLTGRNFEHLDRGLQEMCRVLRPGGHLVILELSTPERFPMKQLFSIYSKVAMPVIGRSISHDNSAYTYLPESIRAFPQGEVMSQSIRRAGFSEVRFKRLTFGVCTLYMATK